MRTRVFRKASLLLAFHVTALNRVVRARRPHARQPLPGGSAVTGGDKMRFQRSETCPRKPLQAWALIGAASPQTLRSQSTVSRLVTEKWSKSLKSQCLENYFVIRRNYGLERHKCEITANMYFFNIVNLYHACKVVKQILLNSEWNQM